MAFKFPKIDWDKVVAVTKKVVVPVLRVVTLGLVGKKAGRVTDFAADVLETAAEAGEHRSIDVIIPKAGALVKEGHDLIK